MHHPAAMLDDVRVALRNLRHEPGYSAAAILTLALTIGATTAIFSAVHAILLSPGAVHQPASLVVCWGRDDARNLALVELSYRNFADWAANTRRFVSMAAMGSSTWPAVLDPTGGRGEPARLSLSGVSASFFDMLGVRPALGRGVRADDDLPNAPRVAVLGHRLWTTRFGGDPAVVGTSIMIDEAPHIVAGVMPADFDFPRGTDVWTPVVPILAGSDTGWRPERLEQVGVLYVVGRLRERVTPAMAREELDAIATRIQRSGGAQRFGSHVVVTPFLDYSIGPVRGALWALFAAVGVLLLIGCANVSGLMLTRVSSRRRDHAIRLALGATPAAIGRLWIWETSTLTAIGGGAGLLAAQGIIKAVVALAPADLARLSDVSLDTTVAAFGCAVVVAATVLCGAGPLRHAIGSNVASISSDLNDAARATAGRRARRYRSALVVLEIGLAIALMVAAGLVVRSFVNLRNITLGFAPARVLTLTVNPRSAAVHSDWMAGLLARVTQLAGVEDAGAIYLRPLALGPIGQETSVVLEGQPDTTAAARQNPALNYQVATPGYFTTMRIPLKRGRLFTPQDDQRAARVALVSENTARRLWPAADAVGKRILMPTFADAGPARAWRTVVGVVSDVRYRGVDDVRLDVYDPAPQSPLTAGDLVVRTASDPLRAAAAVQAAARDLDPRVLISNITTLDAVVARAVAPWRFSVWVFTLFAALALVLATGGLFSLVSLDVGSRRREFAVRVALGAQRGDIIRSVLGSAMRRLVVGVVLGGLVAAAGAGVTRSLLFGVEPLDVGTFGTVIALVCVVVTAASYLPARRAAAEDPLRLLRCE